VAALNLELAQKMLDELAPAVARPAGEPSLRLEGAQMVVVPGEPGRELDVEATLKALAAAYQGRDGGPVPLVFHSIQPSGMDVAFLQAQVDALLGGQVKLTSYDGVTDRTFAWTLGGEDIASWLRLESADDGATLTVRVSEAAVRRTLETLEAGLGEGRGFRMEEAVKATMAACEQGGGSVALYMTHAPRTYTVRAGDTASKIATRHGLPLWTFAQANTEVDLDLLQVGQKVVIPTQDILTPHLPVPGKRIVVDLSEQRMRVYQNGALLHNWIVSTGRKSSPTHTGVFQVLAKEENAYASQWDLLMPHFLGIYDAGPNSINGIHALPILSNGARLWAGNLGSPVSYGCIILGVKEAETLFAWAEVGVLVVIRQ